MANGRLLPLSLVTGALHNFRRYGIDDVVWLNWKVYFFLVVGRARRPSVGLTDDRWSVNHLLPREIFACCRYETYRLFPLFFSFVAPLHRFGD